MFDADLSSSEKAAIRNIALGYVDEPVSVLRSLAGRGLVEDGPDVRLTAAGWAWHDANPPRRRGSAGRRSKL
jgi:hypothetical protein